MSVAKYEERLEQNLRDLCERSTRVATGHRRCDVFTFQKPMAENGHLECPLSRVRSSRGTVGEVLSAI